MKNKESIDKSAPYRTHGLGKITAPVKPKDEPKSARTTASADLRGGKSK